MHKKNSMIFGIILGILVPVIAFGLFYGLNKLIAMLFTNGRLIFTPATLSVMSLFINVLVFRYYMLKLKMDLTGRGMLLATFLYAIVYFFKFW